MFAPSCTRNDRAKNGQYFLDFSGDDYSLVLSKENIIVLCKAMDRANLHYDGSAFCLGVTCAQDINVSERVFDYLVTIVANTNKSGIVPFMLLQTKNGDYPYSCVAYTLSQLVGAPDFNTINNWITSTFPLDGFVPSNKIDTTLTHFFGDCFNQYTTNTIPEDIEWSCSRTFGYYITLSGFGHMVNIVGRRSNGDFLVQDFSADTVETTNVFSSSMVRIYESFYIDSLAVEL